MLDVFRAGVACDVLTPSQFVDADTHVTLSDVVTSPKRSPRPKKFVFAPATDSVRLTHQLFRFPAKFHPPVVRALLERYTGEGDAVLDPFCGSGTLLVEAAVTGRRAIGTDVDPLAVFVSSVKCHPLDPHRLERAAELLQERLERWRRPLCEYAQLQWNDIGEPEFVAAQKTMSLPAIPNLSHWFRRYVAIDLARIRDEVLGINATTPQRRFFLLCFASIIRGASNADPVPVSGLEVTAHMKRREAAGRVIDPFALFELAVRRGLRDMGDFYERADTRVGVSARRADATTLATHFRQSLDAVITSPPYHGAVDYYRRHQLEMFWLGLTKTQKDRLALLDAYIGRPRVPRRLPFLREPLGGGKCAMLERRMRRVDAVRADAFKHYCVAMRWTFRQLAKLLSRGAPLIVVVGHSGWNGDSLNTSDLLAELAEPHFERDEWLYYPVKNRYMSYQRHNGASIDREYVLVLRRAANA